MDEYANYTKKPEENMRKHLSYNFKTKQTSEFPFKKKIKETQNQNFLNYSDLDFFQKIMESQRQSCLMKESLLQKLRTESNENVENDFDDSENYYFDKTQFQTLPAKKKGIFEYNPPKKPLTLQQHFISSILINKLP